MTKTLGRPVKCVPTLASSPAITPLLLQPKGRDDTETMKAQKTQELSINNYSQSSSLSSSALRPSRGLLGALLGTPDAAPTMS